MAKTKILIDTTTRPSLGLTLLLSLIFGFLGVDRFYIGGKQTKYGVLILLGTLILIGLPINIFIIFISQISLMISILRNKNTAFMYGDTHFETPTKMDKILVVCYLVFLLLFIIVSGVIVL